MDNSSYEESHNESLVGELSKTVAHLREQHSLDELELYLSKRPAERPTFKSAVNLRLFDLYKCFSDNLSTISLNGDDSLLLTRRVDDSDSSLKQDDTGQQQQPLDTLKSINSLEELEAEWSKVVDYLEAIVGASKQPQSQPQSQLQQQQLVVTEKLVELLLRPFMFYSSRVRQVIFPSVFIPREEYAKLETAGGHSAMSTATTAAATMMSTTHHKSTHKASVGFNLKHFFHTKLLLLLKSSPSASASASSSVVGTGGYQSLNGGAITAVNEADNQAAQHQQPLKHSPPPAGHCSLEPFIDLDKYKAFVLPRILNLFSMHIAPVRLVLLEYFPFYIYLINDTDTLKYELLPELLLGLKDKNDQIVSLTFTCLSIMVNLLGAEAVVGKSAPNERRQKYFSDNLPKVSVHFRLE
jgi:hypothetical protein